MYAHTEFADPETKPCDLTLILNCEKSDIQTQILIQNPTEFLSGVRNLRKLSYPEQGNILRSNHYSELLSAVTVAAVTDASEDALATDGHP